MRGGWRNHDDGIACNARLRNVALTLMEELIQAGNADLATHSKKARLDRDATVKNMFHLTDTLGAYKPNLLLDFLENKQVEVEAIFVEPQYRTQSLGIDTPQSNLLASILVSLNTRQ